MKYITYTSPAGQTQKLYDDMMQQAHVLIAGETGCGKSTLIEALIHSILFNLPTKARLILIDPKRVALNEYKALPHTIKYANKGVEMIQALKFAEQTMETRFSEMENKGIKEYDGSHVYVIIDELADLMTTNGKVVTPIIQRLCQLGRAARVHVIAATQCPTAAVIPTVIKVNFTAKVGMHVNTAQQSRNIIGCKGCEMLPQHGKIFYQTGKYNCEVNARKVDETERQRVIEHWKRQVA